MKRFVEPPLISCSLTFCSLSQNQISDEGARELAAALQVNQGLQTLEWVQPFHVLLLKRCTLVLQQWLCTLSTGVAVPVQCMVGFGWSYWNAWYSLASYQGSQWAGKMRAWYPLFVASLPLHNGTGLWPRDLTISDLTWLLEYIDCRIVKVCWLIPSWTSFFHKQ